MKSKLKKIYLCGVAFQHELGQTDDISIYRSLASCKKALRCWRECGIVRLELESLDNLEDWLSATWVEEQNFSWYSKRDPKAKT